MQGRISRISQIGLIRLIEEKKQKRQLSGCLFLFFAFAGSVAVVVGLVWAFYRDAEIFCLLF